MTDGWYVRRDGKEIGPISDGELRSLATRGDLSPDDLVWKKGLNEWANAGTVTGLFPSSLGNGSSGAANGGALRPPDPLAALQEEKAKIQSTSLPQAYAEFGRAFYERVDHAVADSVPQEVVPLIKQIDGLLSVLTQQIAPASSADPSKPASQWATGSAMAKATEKEIRKKYAQLGKRAYDRGDHPASCKEEVLTIRALTSRDAAITQQIAALKQKAAVKAARKPNDDIAAKAMQSLEDLGHGLLDVGHGLLFSTAVVCLLAVLVPPIGLFLIWRHPTWGKFSKIRWATISAVCFLSLLMIETTKHVAGTGLGVVAEGARVVGSGVYDFAASNGIVTPEKKPKWLAGSAKEWVKEPPLVQLDGDTPPPPPAQASAPPPSAPKPTPPQAVTFDSFRGEWKATLVEEFASRMPDSEMAQQDRRLFIDGPAFTMERTKDNQRGSYQGTFRFDPATKSFEWSGTGPGGGVIEWVGIYELSGDVLKLCYRQKRGTDSPQRPTAFRSDDEKPAALNFEYRRLSQQVRNPPTPPPVLASTPPSPTSSGTQRRGGQLGNRFYKLEEKVLGWHEAKEYCELRGGRLAVIDTAEKMAFVQQLARSSGITFDAMDGIWIGATDEAEEGAWKWMDGSSVAYANWGKGQPNNKGSAEHYAMIWTNDWSWSDQPDKSTQHRTFFICEWDK
jgi:uncharacterized protein (TIGR03067 family)